MWIKSLWWSWNWDAQHIKVVCLRIIGRKKKTSIIQHIFYKVRRMNWILRSKFCKLIDKMGLIFCFGAIWRFWVQLHLKCNILFSRICFSDIVIWKESSSIIIKRTAYGTLFEPFLGLLAQQNCLTIMEISLDNLCHSSSCVYPP